ncbi:fumarylacetoacetate hydrolase family protein [Rhodococcus koreensis]|uniref:fumarylacetoacetate hydrolase family protein n=1 Tax=Rhodococcus koreensis TaxID=99653 RepID=UPI00366CDB71
MTWSLVTCRTGHGSNQSEIPAIRRADGRYVVPDILRAFAGLTEALDNWSQVEPALRAIDPDTLEPVDATEVLSVRYPRKLLCVGANYRDHIAEMGVTEIPEGCEPFFFTVPTTTTMIGDGEPITIPRDPAYRVDWEAELAIVIGTGGRDIDAADAGKHIAGYACFNDVTARGLLARKVTIAPPFTWDWAGSKGLDTFCPLGPVTPAWQIENAGDLEIRCTVNGVVKQKGSSANLLHGIETLVAAASRRWTLEPGDVIATGTPAGVGHTRGEQLTDGDLVRVDITGLAPLANPVVFR